MSPLGAMIYYHSLQTNLEKFYIYLTEIPGSTCLLGNFSGCSSTNQQNV